MVWECELVVLYCMSTVLHVVCRVCSFLIYKWGPFIGGSFQLRGLCSLTASRYSQQLFLIFVLFPFVGPIFSTSSMNQTQVRYNARRERTQHVGKTSLDINVGRNMLRSLVAMLDVHVAQYWHMLRRVWNRSNFSSNICYHFFRSRNRWSVPQHSFAWFVQHCSACACALTPVQTNLFPRAIRGLGLTNDPGTGCKMCKILAHFPSWYHGKVAPGYSIWRFAAFSILCAVSTVYAFFLSRLSGDRCSWCPSFYCVLMR